jgi:hypothetical protein
MVATTQSTARPSSNQSSLALVPPRSATGSVLDLAKSVDLRSMPRLSYGSGLQLMLESSEQLLKKVYRLRKGINSRYHPTCAELEKTCSEVGATQTRAPQLRQPLMPLAQAAPSRPPQLFHKLAKGFPENPQSLALDKMDSVSAAASPATRV